MASLKRSLPFLAFSSHTSVGSLSRHRTPRTALEQSPFPGVTQLSPSSQPKRKRNPRVLRSGQVVKSELAAQGPDGFANMSSGEPGNAMEEPCQAEVEKQSISSKIGTLLL
ncbi:tubulin polymerization-promoting protein family member 3-like [Arapaima gigas]